jgi:hypothetical protein
MDGDGEERACRRAWRPVTSGGGAPSPVKTDNAV